MPLPVENDLTPSGYISILFVFVVGRCGTLSTAMVNCAAVRIHFKINQLDLRTNGLGGVTPVEYRYFFVR